MKRHPSITTDVLSFVAGSIERALRDASASLTEHGVRHAVCGGLAVGAYGVIRATKDVDFLAGDEAFIMHGGLVTFAPGVPFNVGGIPTDMVSLTDETRFFEAELDDPFDFDGMPIVSPECLVTMKLIAFRRKDKDDVYGLVEAGATTWAKVRRYLNDNGRNDLLVRLDAIEGGGE